MQPPKQPSAMRASGVAAFPAAAFAIKQKLHGDKVEKYRALANEWIAQQQNPDMERTLQESAKNDPKIAKALEAKKKEFVKMVDEAHTDPNSAASQGIQKAYRDQEQREQQRFNMQEMQAKMEQQRALAAQEQARAQDYARLAQTRGEVTPVEEFKEQQKNMRASAQINSRVQMQQNSLESLETRAANRIMSLEKISKMLEQGRNARASQAEGGKDKRAGARFKTQQSAVADMIKQMNAIKGQITNKKNELKNIQDQATKWQNWVTGDSDALNMQATGIQSDLQDLDAQFNQIDMKVTMLTQNGVIPEAPTQSAPAPGGASGQPTIHDFTK
jgi:hypothetical protein